MARQVRGRLKLIVQADPLNLLQFIAEGSLLLMSMSGSKAVEDSSLVLVIQKGASATATALRQAVAAARALAVEISLMPKLGT